MAGELSQLTVTIRGDASQLASTLNNAKQQASGFGSHFGGVMSGAGKAIGNVASIASGFVVGQGLAKLPGFFVEAATAAAQDEAATLRLQQAVRNLGGDYDSQLAAVNAQIAAGQKLAFSDDDIRDSYVRLAAATGSSEEALKRQNAAMDLARGAGIPLADASKLLGKITDENIQVFKRMGITLTESSTEAEALAEVQKKFAGQAEVFANSTAGQFEQAKIALSEIVESIGAAVLPAITKIASVAAENLPKLQELIGNVAASIATVFDTLNVDAVIAKLRGLFDFLSEHKELLVGLGIAVTAVLVPSFAAWAVAAGAAAVATIAAAAPVIAIGLAIGGLIIVVRTLIEHWDEITAKVPLLGVATDIVGRALSALKDLVTDVAGGLIDAFQHPLDFLRDHWPEIATLLTGPFAPIVALATDAFGVRSALITAVTETLPELAGKLAEWAGAFSEWIGPAIDRMLAGLGDLLSRLGAWAVDTALPAIKDKMVEWGAAFIEWVPAHVPGLLAELGNLLIALGGWIIDAVVTIQSKVIEWGVAFVSWVAPRAAELLVNMAGLLAQLTGWMIGTALPEIVSNLLQWAGKFISWVATDVLPNLPGALAGIISAIGGWVTGTAIPWAAGALRDVGVALIQGIGAGIDAAWGALVGKLQGLVSGLPGPVKAVLGISSPSTVFAEEVGVPIVEGVAQGIENATPIAVAAAETMATQVATAAAGAVEAALAAAAGGLQQASNTVFGPASMTGTIGVKTEHLPGGVTKTTYADGTTVYNAHPGLLGTPGGSTLAGSAEEAARLAGISGLSKASQDIIEAAATMREASRAQEITAAINSGAALTLFEAGGALSGTADHFGGSTTDFGQSVEQFGGSVELATEFPLAKEPPGGAGGETTAQFGGTFTGPESGYRMTLHGREDILPHDDPARALAIIRKSGMFDKMLGRLGGPAVGGAYGVSFGGGPHSAEMGGTHVHLEGATFVGAPTEQWQEFIVAAVKKAKQRGQLHGVL